MGIRRIILCSVAVLSLHIGCSQKNKNAAEEMPTDEGTEIGVVLDRESVDFGVVKMGDVLSRRVKIKNHTGEAVQITGVKASCSCTQCTISRETLKRGEEATIEVMLDTHGLIGRQYHKVTVATDGKEYEFAVMAEIK
ncbi:MAG: DUF1573 domain-containing protein [Bacteroidales bacterium]|nr:DUF1573 domain-containing protein [Bacteroidales bacterium]